MSESVAYDIDGDVMMYNTYTIIEVKDTDIDKKENNSYKKKYIPLVLKRRVWNEWIGNKIGTYKCLCCKLTDITQLSFHCGHVIAEKNGGTLTVDNLRPICQSCNSSMGTNNMIEFIKKYKL